MIELSRRDAEFQADERAIRRGIMHRRSPYFQAVYDDTRQPADRATVARIHRMDPNLFYRWNRLSSGWELWRYKDPFPPSTRPTRVQDMVRQAVWVWDVSNPVDGSYRDVDFRQVVKLWCYDSFRHAGNVDQVEEWYRTQERRQALAEIRERNNLVDDWASADKNQIRGGFGRGGFISHAR